MSYAKCTKQIQAKEAKNMEFQPGIKYQIVDDILANLMIMKWD